MRQILLSVFMIVLLQARGQNFTAGNIVVYRIGTGAAALTSASTAVYLDEYTQAGILVQSVALPAFVAGSNLALTASGTATSEGLLNRSADGGYLVITGYNAAPGVSNIAGSSVARVVGFIDYQKNTNTSTGLTDYSGGNNPRSAISSDGTTIWATGGAGGVRYTTKGATTSTQINTTGTNFRAISIFAGQLYVSSSSGTIRLATVGSGLPTSTGQAITNLPGFPTAMGSPYQFQFFDLDAGVPGPDVLYVADDMSGTGGVQKYSLVGGNWVLNGVIGAAADAYRGLTGSSSGASVSLFAIRKGSELVSMTDATGYNVAPSVTPTLLTTAATNTAFRGIAFAPVALSNNLSLTFSSTASSASLQPPAVSTTLMDATDPLATAGVSVDVKDNGVTIPAASYSIAVSSSNTTVVPNSNISITKTNGQATILIAAASVGYADVTVTITEGSFTRSITINVAASAASATPSATRFHTGSSDASAAIALDNNYMIVGDDEINRLFVYSRTTSGLPVTIFDYSGLLSLTDMSGGAPREVGLEAGVRSITAADRIYWLGSMSNSASSFAARQNRNRLFAVTATGTGSSTSFGYVGMYAALRQDLISWGDANGYDFTTAAASGKDPKMIDGFNVEGMCFAPDNTTAYIAFRAPLVPTANRAKAVIAPIQNFEAWFNNGSPSGSPIIGAPIELNLGGRGFRDIVRLSNGNYVILAGNYGDTPLDPAIYTWNGTQASSPAMINSFTLTDLNPEGVMEIQSSGTLLTDRLQLVSDNGSVIYYNDALEAKDLSQNNYKKFRSDVVISASGGVLPLVLKSFNVEKAGSAALLNWEITMATPANNFVIERSVNGYDFTTIAKVPALANEVAYQYSDVYPAGGKIYYRIAIVDGNGKKTYSSIRMLITPAMDKVVLYPNPVMSGVLTITTSLEGNKYITIFDVAGKKLKVASFNGSSIDVITSDLAKGDYYIVVATKEKIVYSNLFVIP